MYLLFLSMPDLHRKNFIAQDGERFTLLVNEDGIPDFWTTLYMTTKVRSQTQATQRAHLNNLVHINIWEQIVGERLSDKIIRAFNGHTKILNDDLFTTNEIHQIGYHCKLTSKAARRNLKASSKKTRNDNLIKFISPVSKIPDPIVGVEQQIGRIHEFAEYFEFLAINILKSKPSFSAYLDQISRIKSNILKQKSKGRSSRNKVTDPDRKAPPAEVFDEVMRIVDLENPMNPFTSAVRTRNYLLFRVLYETGMRTGEILQLKITDIDFSDSAIQIRRRHNDPEDTKRRFEPNAKTEERDIPISRKLSNELRNYILYERREIPNTKSHSFLFVSDKGKSKGDPLSLIQFSKMVEKVAVSEKLADFIKKNGFSTSITLTKHSFRHNFNNRFSKIIDTNNALAVEEGRLNDVISEKKEIEQRMYLNGHRSADSATVYNLRHTKEQAEKLLKNEQNRIDEHLRIGEV